MKALILNELNKPLVCEEIEKPTIGVGEALVRVQTSAMNHRDVYISKGQYAKIRLPVVLGSDGTGEVEQVGAGVDEHWIGQRVVINPNINWGDNPKVQSKAYNILGMPTNGCFAQYVRVSASQLAPCPPHLTAVQAAALPLGGLTAYRALCTRGQLQGGERVLVSGVGGGVALFALQFALALGAEVYVTSGDDNKIEKAVALGAKGGVNYRTENWHKQLQTNAGGGFDVIIDSAGGDGFGLFMDIANPGARIVFYGGTRGDFKLNPQKVFWKQLSILGSTMGSDADFFDMLNIVNQHKIIPVVDSVWQLEQGNEAFALMEAGKQFGKIVFEVGA